MKNRQGMWLLAIGFLVLTGYKDREDRVEFVCLKTHKASNTCHWNFTVDGGQFRYEDLGCKYNKKRDKLFEKVKVGEIILAKDWKIGCPQPKHNPKAGF